MARYKADAHVIQMKILRELLLSTSLSFADIQRASGVSSDHANFHIKQLVLAGFVRHVSKLYGSYELTIEGKEYANRMDTDDYVIEKQPKLSIVLDIIGSDDKHLQQERLKQRYYGYWGRPTGKIRWGETILEAAARELFEETGLTAKLVVLGFYHNLDYDESGNLLEDKYLCLVRGTDPQGELLAETDGQRNVWLTDEEYSQKDKTFGTLEAVEHLIANGQMFVHETKTTYPREAY